MIVDRANAWLERQDRGGEVGFAPRPHRPGQGRPTLRHANFETLPAGNGLWSQDEIGGPDDLGRRDRDRLEFQSNVRLCPADLATGPASRAHSGTIDSRPRPRDACTASELPWEAGPTLLTQLALPPLASLPAGSRPPLALELAVGAIEPLLATLTGPGSALGLGIGSRLGEGIGIETGARLTEAKGLADG